MKMEQERGWAIPLMAYIVLSMLGLEKASLLALGMSLGVLLWQSI